ERGIQGMVRGAAITLHSKAAVGFLLQQPSIRDVAYLVFQLDAVVVGRNRHSIDDVPHETRGPRLAGFFLQPRCALPNSEDGVDRWIAGDVALRHRASGCAACVLVNHVRKAAALLSENIVHVGRAETGAEVSTQEQAVYRPVLKACLPGEGATDIGDVVVAVIAASNSAAKRIENRDAEL